jgi:hypothetical protein
MIPIPFGSHQNKIKITMTPTANFVAGINLTFASGTLTFNPGDGGASSNFVSGTEKLYTYANAGTYVAEISGDLANITKFIADNCRITKIENLKTGLLTDFRINNNLYSGILDMSLAPVSGIFYCYTNPNLTGIIFKSTGNSRVNDFEAYGCNITGILDLVNVPIGTIFLCYSNPNLTNINLSLTGNTIMFLFQLNNCNLTDTLDLRNVGIYYNFFINNNPNLTNILFKSTGNSYPFNFRLYSCNLDYINLISGGMVYNVNSANIDIKNNGMSAADVNHILVDIDSIAPSGYTGRIINIGGTNADPDSSSGGYDGVAARNSLIAKGFTVTII